MRIAVIDLGTNTFNLLICDIAHSSYNILHESKVAPRLGKEGIQNGILAKQAITRGITGLTELNRIIREYGCEQIIAIGTSALRNATNAQDFVTEAKDKLGINITIIQGEQEAEYVFQGNRLAYNWGGETAMILDIGGGSNEIIICDSQEIYWKHSFENGMQRIYNSIDPTFPLSEENIDSINAFLHSSFALLKEQAQKYKIDLLVGSSGPYDTFKDIVHIQNKIQNHTEAYYELKIADLNQIHSKLTSCSKQEIHDIPGMDPARVELIPIASCVTQFLIEEFNIPRVIQSEYSLKEGVISTLMF
jgi:exopolyphosphatase/guanosine-5'-triphosphate,3'-diphosphate pyrophosphatase